MLVVNGEEERFLRLFQVEVVIGFFVRVIRYIGSVENWCLVQGSVENWRLVHENWTVRLWFIDVGIRILIGKGNFIFHRGSCRRVFHCELLISVLKRCWKMWKKKKKKKTWELNGTAILWFFMVYWHWYIFHDVFSSVVVNGGEERFLR